MSNVHDSRTLLLFNKVKEKREKIARAKSNPPVRTNLSIDLTEVKFEGVKNLRTMTVDQLVAVATLIRSRGALHEETATLLGVSNPNPHKICGYVVEEWLEDIRNLVARAQLAQEEADLKTLESRLDAVVSPELRRELELEAIANLLE